MALNGTSQNNTNFMGFVVVVNCDLVCAPRMVIRYVNEILVKRSTRYGYAVLII